MLLRELFPQQVVLRTYTHELVDPLHVPADLKPLDNGRAARGLEEARQDIDRGCLSVGGWEGGKQGCI